MIKISDTLSLRLLTLSDTQSIFDIIDSQRDYLREWLPFVDQTHRVEDTQKAIEMLIDPELSLNRQFIIIYNDILIGMVGFKDTQKTTRKTEIGYWMSQEYQGRGIMTSVVTKLLEYAFLVMNMNRVIIKVAVANQKSRRIPERIGFVQEGIERESDLLVDNVFTDIVVYSMLQREYIEKIENADIKIS